MNKKPTIVKGKHELSEQELIGAGKDLANALKEKESLSEKLKEESQKFKDKIAEQDKAINECLEKIRTGEEDRDYECEVERDEENKQKKYIHKESGRIIKTAPFTAADYQLELAGEGEQKADKKPKKKDEA